MKKEIWKGSEAIAEAAVRGGCRAFFGYPITPQNEIPEYMSWRMPEAGGVFLQAESELAAVNMVYGAAASGVRAMTSSSSPGISLKQEGISYMAAAELPAVIVNVMRGGSGLGTIQPSQADYYQATRGGGNGDYRLLVLAPSGVQEAADLMQEAFDLADRYSNPVMLLADGLIAQMMEPIVWHERTESMLPPKDWAASGRGGRERPHFVTSLLMDAQECEERNLKMAEKYALMAEENCRFEEIMTEDAEIIIAAYGTMARIAQTAAERLREGGIRAGVFRPITLFPFPQARLRELADGGTLRYILTVEMSLGQMVDDVRLAAGDRVPVGFYGRTGGVIPSVSEVEAAALRALDAC